MSARQGPAVSSYQPPTPELALAFDKALKLWLATTSGPEVERQRVRALIEVCSEDTTEFTVRDLRLTADYLHHTHYKPDAFRRMVLPYLTPTGATTEGTQGKPAALYTYQGRSKS